jgi:hypothetical protein
MAFYVLGAYMGLIVDAKYYQGTVKSVNRTPFLQTLMRLLISLVFIVPVYVCPIYLIGATQYVFLVLLFKYALPTFGIAFLLFGFSKQVYQRFGVVNNDDMDIQLDIGKNIGRLEMEEDFKEMQGNQVSKLLVEGIKAQNTF